MGARFSGFAWKGARYRGLPGWALGLVAAPGRALGTGACLDGR